ncbi:MAG: ribbon-helix-helix domain-containing protein [Eubacteriales bacterium]
MTPRTGRPTEDPRRNQYRIRLTDEEVEKLEFCSQTTGKSKADIIREGIDTVYEKLNEK